MFSDDLKPAPPGTSVTAVGIDHVRLAYHYLDTGDMDAYGSLLDENALLWRPDGAPGYGRAEILEVQAALTGPPVEHHIHKIIASGGVVAVTGRCTSLPGRTGMDAGGVDFADIFTLTDEGLLLGCRRYYYVAPPPHDVEGV
jgi:hypothetical protein